MPTVLRIGPYRFYFYSHDLREPSHVHVDAGEKTAKLWLNPISVARNIGFSAIQLNRIINIAGEHEAQMLKAWNEHLGKQSG